MKPKTKNRKLRRKIINADSTAHGLINRGIVNDDKLIDKDNKLIMLNPTVTAKKIINIKNSRNFCNLNQ